MQCQPRVGYAWLQQHRPNWMGEERLLAGHLAWHGALYVLEGGKPREALQAWDQDIAPLTRAHGGGVLDLVDATSLLLRLELAGIEAADLAERYESLLPYWETQLARRVLVFNDLHMLIAAEGARRTDLATKVMKTLDEWAHSAGVSQQAEVARAVGSPLSAAIHEWRARDYKSAADHLSGVLPLVHTIGGSHAQRDLFPQLALHSSLRASLPGALPLAQERALARPESAAAWSAYATAVQQRAASLVW